MAAARTKVKPVRVLAVHGMLTAEPNFSKQWQAPIAERLDLIQVKETSLEIIHRGYTVQAKIGSNEIDSGTLLESQMRITEWAPRSDSKNVQLVFYELLWAPMRDQLKQRYLSCFETHIQPRSGVCTEFSSARQNTDVQTMASGMVKNGLMVGGLADATLVLSEIGDVLRDDVRLAVCRVAKDVVSAPMDTTKRCRIVESQDRQIATFGLSAQLTDASSEFFTITHSLGSFLVMDAQQGGYRTTRSLADQEAPAPDTLARLETLAPLHIFDRATVYMFANQVSLLELGRIRAICTNTENDSCEQEVSRGPKRIDRDDGFKPGNTTYVAFNDINDMLGFELPPYLPKFTDFARMVNVSVKNPAFIIPGMFKDPSGAHTKQGSNPAIITRIVEGLDITSDYIVQREAPIPGFELHLGHVASAVTMDAGGRSYDLQSATTIGATWRPLDLRPIALGLSGEMAFSQEAKTTGQSCPSGCFVKGSMGYASLDAVYAFNAAAPLVSIFTGAAVRGRPLQDPSSAPSADVRFPALPTVGLLHIGARLSGNGLTGVWSIDAATYARRDNGRTSIDWRFGVGMGY